MLVGLQRGGLLDPVLQPLAGFGRDRCQHRRGPASASVSQTNRWRAAGHTAHSIARIAVSGVSTTMKWTSRDGREGR